jgi:hypothetical protein
LLEAVGLGRLRRRFDVLLAGRSSQLGQRGKALAFVVA